MKIPYQYKNFNPDAPAEGYWDQSLLQRCFSDKKIFRRATKDDRFSIIVIPANQNSAFVAEIQEYINRYEGVVVILTGNEDQTFPIEKLSHKSMKLWLMEPNPEKIYDNIDRFIPCGTTPHCEKVPKRQPAKDKEWFFAGQVTHSRRHQCVAQLREMKGGELLETKGFAKGIEPKEYMKKMLASMVIPCPAGIVLPDSFRVYEALESGAIPIVDAISAVSNKTGYWGMIFGEDYPFPLIEDWDGLPKLIARLADRNKQARDE